MTNGHQITSFLFSLQALKIKEHCWAQSSLDEYIRAALKCVMTNSLAGEFSWAGRTKLPFFNQKFVKLLNGMYFLYHKHSYFKISITVVLSLYFVVIIKKYTNFKRNKDDMKIVVQSWLRLALQRSGGAHFNKWRGGK